jgi:hypothetical protein
MPDFQEFLDILKGKIWDFAKSNWKEHQDAVVSDGSDFLNKAKEDIKRWTRLLAEGSLSQDDFKWLVEGKRDLAEMKALERAGLALVQVDKCRNGILEIVVGTAFDFFT